MTARRAVAVPLAPDAELVALADEASDYAEQLHTLSGSLARRGIGAGWAVAGIDVEALANLLDRLRGAVINHAQWADTEAVERG